MLPIHLQTSFAAMPSARFDELDVEQPGKPLDGSYVDSKREDGKPSAAYHQWLPAGKTLRTVSLSLHPSDALLVEAVVIAVEASVECPPADVAPCSAERGLQKAVHITILWSGI